jgi:6-pyruvoyltetrahydropterin/6-carboxytetrahydropterin synthase
MTIDFGIVKNELNKLMNYLDHSYLNDLPSFRNQNPTSENIAKFIFAEMKKKLTVADCRIAEVEVWESEKSSIIYFE